VPRLFAVADGQFALAFDSAERLAEFAGQVVAYAEMPGRAAVLALAGQAVGLAVNPGDTDHAFLMPAAALDWLAGTLAQAPAAGQARLTGFAPPEDLPLAVLAALDAAFSRARGLAAGALLAGASDSEGRRRQVLVFAQTQERDRAALAGMVSQALVFSGADDGDGDGADDGGDAGGDAGGGEKGGPVAIDVAFLPAGDPALAAMAAVARIWDLTPLPPDEPPVAAPQAPGTDSARPPRLR